MNINDVELNDKFSNMKLNNNKLNIKTKEDLLMISLTDFFSCYNNISKMLPIISGISNNSGKSKISLRILDWFVTNYAKKYNIKYDIINVNKVKKRFIVYLEYKAQLKAYSKKEFDPFCRRDRISFSYHENEEEIITTVGQLNFFRWAISNGILDYVEQNLESIETDMNNMVKNLYKNSINNNDNIIKKRKKRHQLSISATRGITKQDVQIIVNFD